jgi:CubicO group peptidase (beta-lactamase class C family)
MKKKMKKIPIIAIALAACCTTFVLAQPAPPREDSPDRADPAYAVTADPALTDFDKFVEAELKKWNTPGIAITVVKDGKVILKRGYGFRDVEKKLPMTELTVQPIASVTKSFTVASLATLVREGKLSWDKPVRDYLPDFKMFNDYTTMNATPRDLVTHRTGLPRHDGSWYNATASREELYKRLQHLEPSAQLRATWQYNNFMFMTAGYMGGKVAGSDWETLVRNNLFKPLGMLNSTFTIDDMLKAQHVGKGYKWNEKEQAVVTPYRGLSAMGPTGSINSNMEDMSRYLRMYLARGQFEGKTIINAADIVEMTNPQMVMADARRFEEISSTQYGMGLFLTHYRGERLVHHGGNMPGSSSLLSFLPMKNIGVFTTTNISGSQLPTIVTYAIYDRLLKMAAVDWSGRFWEAKEKNKASEDSAKKQNLSPRKLGTKPTHQLSVYAGDYMHPGYGTFNFSETGDGLIGSYNGLSSLFPHYHYDVFAAPDDKLNDMANTKVQFVTDLDGEVSSVQIAMETSVKPIVFARQPDANFKDANFLKRFVGEYELGPTKVTITLRNDNVLTIAIPGQATRELVGVREQKFNVKTANAANGISIEFTNDKSGKVNQAAFYQPSGNFVAVKSAAK